jgi:hypothetical protein
VIDSLGAALEAFIREHEYCDEPHMGSSLGAAAYGVHGAPVNAKCLRTK